MKAISLIFLILISSSSLLGLDKGAAKDVLIQANAALDSKNYEEAIKLYQSITGEYESAQLFHNYSLALYYQGNLGKSILYMEKAHRIAPLNKNINKNLKLLEENVDSEITEIPDFFLKSWLNSISNITGSSVWLLLHLATLCVAMFFLYYYLIKGSNFNLHFYYIRGAIIAMFLLSFLFAGLSYNRSVLLNNNDLAIVIQDEVPLRMGAEANSQEVMKVNQGVKVKIEDEIGEFYKVKLQDYTESWVKKEYLEVI